MTTTTLVRSDAKCLQCLWLLVDCLFVPKSSKNGNSNERSVESEKNANDDHLFFLPGPSIWTWIRFVALFVSLFVCRFVCLFVSLLDMTLTLHSTAQYTESTALPNYGLAQA